MTLDEAFEARIEAAVERVLGRYLSRLDQPEKYAYNLRETAESLSTSTHTIRSLVEDEILPLVPHMGHRKLIPRAAIQAHAEANMKPAAS